jgi:hypothetical protein
VAPAITVARARNERRAIAGRLLIASALIGQMYALTFGFDALRAGDWLMRGLSIGGLLEYIVGIWLLVRGNGSDGNVGCLILIGLGWAIMVVSLLTGR